MGSCSFLLFTEGPMKSETFLKWLLMLIRLPFSFYKPAGICAICLQYPGWFYMLFIATSLVLLELQCTKLVVRRRKWIEVCRDSNCWKRLHKPTISTLFLRREKHDKAPVCMLDTGWEMDTEEDQSRWDPKKTKQLVGEGITCTLVQISLICFLQFLYHTNIYGVSF